MFFIFRFLDHSVSKRRDGQLTNEHDLTLLKLLRSNRNTSEFHKQFAGPVAHVRLYVDTEGHYCIRQSLVTFRCRSEKTCWISGEWHLIVWNLTLQSPYRYQGCRTVELRIIFSTWRFLNMRRNFGTRRQRLNLSRRRRRVQGKCTTPTFLVSSAQNQTHNRELSCPPCYQICYRGWKENDIIENRVIQTSDTPEASLIVIVCKTETSCRFSADYRKLHQIAK